MTKCPDCAEENINESLFCKNCGRCLLAPDPERGQRSIATHTEYHETHESIEFYDSDSLLAPDPEKGQWSTATHTEHHKTHESIDLYDGHIVKNSSVAKLKGRQQTVPAVIQRWLLLLNLVVFILMFEIVRYIFSR